MLHMTDAYDQEQALIPVYGTIGNILKAVIKAYKAFNNETGDVYTIDLERSGTMVDHWFDKSGHKVYQITKSLDEDEDEDSVDDDWNSVGEYEDSVDKYEDSVDEYEDSVDEEGDSVDEDWNSVDDGKYARSFYFGDVVGFEGISQDSKKRYWLSIASST